MKFIRITAKYDDDKNQTLTLVGCWDDNHFIDPGIEIYGKVKDLAEDESEYSYYPFYTRKAGSNELFLVWGGWAEETKDVIDLLGRRLAVGEKIRRTEIQNKASYWEYTITSIHEY